MRTALLAFCLMLMGWSGAASAAPVVRVLETYPAGQSITLPSNQDFYLRLAYESEQPIGIWLSPYYQGKEVRAGTSPSTRYSGKGEALGWFFLHEPGQRVDEIRIRAGDGGYGMPVVATYRVDIAGGSQPKMDPKSPWAPTEPKWLEYMREESKRQISAQMNASQPNAGAAAYGLLGGFMLIVSGLGLGGIVVPIWAMRRWTGAWRLAAAVPLGVLGFVILRIAVDTNADPTSHNLWPFEILQVALGSLLFIGLLGLARRTGSADAGA
jgi:hypothetical protein